MNTNNIHHGPHINCPKCHGIGRVWVTAGCGCCSDSEECHFCEGSQIVTPEQWDANWGKGDFASEMDHKFCGRHSEIEFEQGWS